jgi:hypothetical protein
MSKPVGIIETDIDREIQVLIDTLMDRYGQNKKFHEGGVGGFGPVTVGGAGGSAAWNYADRGKMLKLFIKRAVAANNRGSVTRSLMNRAGSAGTTGTA